MALSEASFPSLEQEVQQVYPSVCEEGPHSECEVQYISPLQEGKISFILKGKVTAFTGQTCIFTFLLGEPQKIQFGQRSFKRKRIQFLQHIEVVNDKKCLFQSGGNCPRDVISDIFSSLVDDICSPVTIKNIIVADDI